MGLCRGSVVEVKRSTGVRYVVIMLDDLDDDDEI